MPDRTGRPATGTGAVAPPTARPGDAGGQRPATSWTPTDQRPVSTPRPGSGTTTGHRQQFSRPFPPVIGDSGHPLPPPPWAQSDSATLAPLPAGATGAAGAQAPTRIRIVAAILVAVVAALAGYFGVRIVADLARTSAAPTAAATAPPTAAATAAPAPAAQGAAADRPAVPLVRASEL